MINNQEIERVEENLMDVISKINDAIDALKNDSKHQKTSILLLFAEIEVFANYRAEYIDANKTKKRNKINITTWTDKFILTEDNKYYNENINYKKLNSNNDLSDELYKMRCSSIHFFSPASKRIFFSPEVKETNEQYKELKEIKKKLEEM